MVKRSLSAGGGGLMKCQDCGVEDETVEQTFCPFAEEIDNKKIEIVVCRKCYQERGWDI